MAANLGGTSGALRARRGRVGAFSGAKPRCLSLLLTVLALATASGPAWADELSVVVSIKPVHSLVASLMRGIGEPVLLVDGAASPHAWTLKPSQAASLANSDLAIWVGEGFETYLVGPMSSLVPDGATLELAALPAIELLPVREGGVWAEHRHGDHDDADDAAHADHAADGHAEDEHAADEHFDHEHGGYDLHFWLDPRNAILVAEAVTARLAAIDPAHADTYGANLATLTERLERLDADVGTRLAAVRDVPFIVFHDAYQYFDRRYGLSGAGSLGLDPEQSPSASRVAALRERIAEGDVVCAFAEPLFDPALLEAVIEGTGVRIATLDPEGVELEAGPALYPDLVANLADAMARCLEPSS